MEVEKGNNKTNVLHENLYNRPSRSHKKVNANFDFSNSQIDDEHFSHAIAFHNLMMMTSTKCTQAVPTVKNMTKSLIQ